MFTGIIKEVGFIEKIEKAKRGINLTIKCEKVLKGLNLGDSVSIDGVCLTVSSISKDSFSAYAGEETLKKTTLARIHRGEEVNLEPALKPEDSLGGHFVQGHTEGLGKVVSVTKRGDEVLIQIKIPKEILKSVIKKGSIAVSGVSLTVSEIKDDVIEIFLVPFTLNSTNLKKLKKGSVVNIETDIICRTVISLLENEKEISKNKLIEEGY